jgi:DNA-binding NarL/FixJ family response regulator
MSPPMTILVADDHPIFRQGLRQLLEREPGFSVVGDAGDGPSALAGIEQLRPRVAVLDIDMPGMDGLAVAGAVRERRLPTAIVCLTMHKDARFLNSALNAGVMGYVIKDDALLEIVESVKWVAAGRHYVSPQLTSHLVARHARAGAAAAQVPGIDALTAPNEECFACSQSSRRPRKSRWRWPSARGRSIGTARTWPKSSA